MIMISWIAPLVEEYGLSLYVGAFGGALAVQGFIRSLGLVFFLRYFP
jgi:hypothetical protein